MSHKGAQEWERCSSLNCVLWRGSVSCAGPWGRVDSVLRRPQCMHTHMHSWTGLDRKVKANPSCLNTEKQLWVQDVYLSSPDGEGVRQTARAPTVDVFPELWAAAASAQTPRANREQPVWGQAEAQGERARESGERKGRAGTVRGTHCLVLAKHQPRRGWGGEGMSLPLQLRRAHAETASLGA